MDMKQVTNEANLKQELERGQELLMRAVGMAGKGWQAGKTQPAEQQLQADTAGGLSARHRPLNKRTAHSWPALQQKQPLQMTSASRRAGKWGECEGVGTQEGGLRPT